MDAEAPLTSGRRMAGSLPSAPHMTIERSIPHAAVSRIETLAS